VADQVSLVFWLVHLDFHGTKLAQACECLFTMVAYAERGPVDPVHEQSPGNMYFLQNHG
jgi:acyl-CoA hydrolase